MAKIYDEYGEVIAWDSDGYLIDENCNHDWQDSELGCEDCGSHSAVRCAECGAVLDLVRYDDPRGS